MIISASRRTDIPCCHAEWFMNRVRAGRVLARNPMNAAQVSAIRLDRAEGVVFWTKDAQPMLAHLDELDGRGLRYYFQFTLTPYGPPLEPGLRPKAEIEKTFCALSRRVGRDGVVWRYDPIVLNDELTVAWHRARFSALCARLAPYTDTVTISFVDQYARVRTPLIRPVSREEMEELAALIGAEAARRGLRAVTCCEAIDLSAFGVGHGACVDGDRLASRCGRLVALKRDRNQRPACLCAESLDIGAYGTCANGCAYCYAGGGQTGARRRALAQDVHAELLGPPLRGGERIIERS